jgi:GalNAc-alpha-(1->4)-GalNAc-alpha-(1->3)-diNAcBac-PP-undecaprenol alpha-1,4-N-acetyl-D-galactosaminyltransferase
MNATPFFASDRTPIRVGLTISSLGPGGAERVMANMVNYWAAKGREVVLITLAPPAGDFYPIHHGVKRVGLDLLLDSHHQVTRAARYNLRRVIRLRQAIQASKPDVVIGFGSTTNVLTIIAGRSLGIPVIASERVDPRHHPIGSAWRVLRFLVYRYANALVVQSPALREWASGFVPDRAVNVIPNAIQPVLNRRQYEPRHHIASVRTVIAMGRLTPQKGFDLLLRAFSKVATKHAEWSLIILGQGEDHESLEGLIIKLGLKDRVTLTGVVQDPTRLLKEADLFVMPSRYEGFPNALLEAMACGLPVIATDCDSGPRDIIRDNVDGLLVPPNDIAVLASAMDCLMGDQAERQRLGARAVDVVERFSTDKIMNMWDNLLTDTAKEGRLMRGQVLHRQYRGFEFGKNWTQFQRVINDSRVDTAQESLKEMLNITTLRDRTFLDIGCGSGLFSLAARQLGARVHSFDHDQKSVACTLDLKRQYCGDDKGWKIEEGSILDEMYVRSLGKFDVVYAWGVLHHTGSMWQALDYARIPVASGGQLFVAIYNDQGWPTRCWKKVKWLYNRLPDGLRFLVVGPALVRLWGPRIVRDSFTGRPFRTWHSYSVNRGMSAWRDVVDWVGGYPFEFATPAEIFEFYRDRGFRLLVLKTPASHACNQFVFERIEERSGL